MPYTGKRRAATATAAPSPEPRNDDAQGAGWIADYYRRLRLAAAVFPVDAAAEGDYPDLGIPAPAYASAAAGLAHAGETEVVPLLAAGVEVLGKYAGSGLTEATYLVRNPAGQVVQVSRLLYLVLDGIDGSRTVAEIAARVTVAFGRTVSAGNVEYLLAKKLAPLGLVTAGDGTGQVRVGGQDPAILALKLRRTLVPAAGVQHLARLFWPLFSPVVVAAVLIGLAVSDVKLVRGGQLAASFRFVLLHPMLLLLVLGLSLLSMLFHECGHAAACRYGGARPGVIGVGFFVIWPAFFTNVTDAYRLGRAGRIRTDLGGVYFNAIFALVLAVAYLATGYMPLLAAVVVVHLEIVQQLLPSLRFDGYFILADLIGVPDLFQRIGPTLLALIPGRPADPRVSRLKRAARVTLTAWVLLVVPLLGVELALIILDGPSLLRTFARSLQAQAQAITAQFGRADIAAALVGVISVVLLVLPTAGLCYILLLSARRALRSVASALRRHPALRAPFAVVALLVASALTVYWGLLPIGRSAVSPRPAQASAAGHLPRPASASARPATSARPAGPPAVVLTPVSAHGFDALARPGADPYDENDGQARYAIDGSMATAWRTQTYFGGPFFGGLKAGTGLILDMGRQVRLSSVTITFGPARGADVAIKIGDDDTLRSSALAAFTTVAAADDVGGTRTFTTASPATGRYVLIWFTKLPPAGSGRYAAQIFNIAIRGTG